MKPLLWNLPDSQKLPAARKNLPDVRSFSSTRFAAEAVTHRRPEDWDGLKPLRRRNSQEFVARVAVEKFRALVSKHFVGYWVYKLRFDAANLQLSRIKSK